MLRNMKHPLVNVYITMATMENQHVFIWNFEILEFGILEFGILELWILYYRWDMEVSIVTGVLQKGWFMMEIPINVDDDWG